MIRFARVLAAVALYVLVAVPAAAQNVGVRAGASVDPDQFYFGGHVETPPLADELRFRPNIEIGIGNDVTVTALNFEFAYFFPESNGWRLYAGAGPALNVFNTDVGTDSEGGFNLVIGGAHEGGLFGEVKFGLLDSPDFKVGVGYAFRWQ